MKFVKLIGAVAGLMIATVGNAYVYDDEAGGCYLFQADKMIKRGVCLISTEAIHGNIYRDLSFEGKTYELHENAEKSNVVHKLNKMPAKLYYRNSRFPKIILNIDDLDSYPFLTCYKNKSVDICYRELVQKPDELG
ncbi:MULTISPECIES: hypothetical protein [Psychrobacter]|uniref:hypothetical protein n=1 Tax=Psychrobacter TaxID=497 RepID=UPI00146A52CC|nr:MULTISPECIES: hypothetical protein [Psychrobacter]